MLPSEFNQDAIARQRFLQREADLREAKGLKPSESWANGLEVEPKVGDQAFLTTTRYAPSMQEAKGKIVKVSRKEVTVEWLPQKAAARDRPKPGQRQRHPTDFPGGDRMTFDRDEIFLMGRRGDKRQVWKLPGAEQ